MNKFYILILIIILSGSFFLARGSDDRRIEKSIATGETESINGVQVTFNKVVEDSRCPIDAVCIWMGRLVANVTLKSSTYEETLNISTDSPSIEFDTFEITLVSGSPSPMASNPPSPSSYKINVKVERLTSQNDASASDIVTTGTLLSAR